MLFLTNFQHVIGSFMKKRKLMTLMKTIFWSLNRQTVFLQNLLNHTRLLFSSISDTSYNFTIECYLCMFAQFLLDFSKQKVCFAQVLAFSKVAKTEGEVFAALWASQGDLEPSRATILPQSPCSLTPVHSLQRQGKVGFSRTRVINLPCVLGLWFPRMLSSSSEW